MSELTDDRLLPCPFCGGKAYAHAKPLMGYPRVMCEGEDCLGRQSGSTIEEAIAAWNRRAAASTSTEGAGVKGLDLEWDSDDPDEIELNAYPIFGHYWTRREWDDTYELRLNYASGSDMFQTMIGTFGTVVAAQAAAQADYEARIRSALNPPTSKVTTDEAEERG